MPRVIKHPDTRRQELLDIAARSFAEHGYDSTTVDDVIRQAGLSKGAFYYYYPSKQALLEGLATAAATRALEALQPVMNASGLGAVDRLNAFLRQGRQTHDAAATLAVFESIFRPDNVVLYHRMHAAVMAVMLPPLTEILAQGVAEGSIRSNDPRTTAELVLMLGTMTHDVVGRLLGAKPQEWAAAIAAFEHRLVEQGIAVDRILGLPDGTVAFVEPGFAEAMFASRRP